jgi:ABC-2 type transport system ATP-binding protein
MTHAIEVSHLTKRFGTVLAVDDLSFTADYGKIVGFLGQNGAGKTTTLRIVLGLASATTGTAVIAGTPYDRLDDPLGTVGAVLDGGKFHPGRTGRNHIRALALAAGLPSQRADEVIEMVGLTEAANRRAGGYSLGMRQRLGLAASLLGDPKILVLDEPANGLDPQGIRWLRDFLRHLASQGRAIVVSSHLLSEIAQTVDEVVVIGKGRSLAQAPIQELMARGQGGMRVAGPDVDRLRAVLDADGATVVADGEGLVVSDRTGEQIGRLIAANAIVVSELGQVSQSLEDVFFELTDTADTEVPS